MSVKKSLAVAHASSFVISLVINGLLILALLFFVNFSSSTPRTVTTITLSPPEELPEIEEPPELEEIDPLENPEDFTFEMDFSFESATTDSVEAQEVVEPVTQSDVAEMSELMSEIYSPVTMNNVMFGRTEAGRRAAIGRYGRGTGGRTEPAVVKALGWLSRVQVKDGQHEGAWLQKGEKGAPNTGMTGLALLTFLAHGETPSSERYGNTVARGIRYLVDNQDSSGIFQPAGPHTGYGHAMATYAIAEAYTMTGNVLLEEPLERALNVLFDGIQPHGGFDYKYNKSKGRSDNSMNAWHVQAMKAARISGVGGNRLENVMQKAMDGMLAVSAKLPDGQGRGFAYSNTKNFQERGSGADNKLISAAGLLSLHLTGRGESREADETMAFVETFLDRENIPEWGKRTYNGHGGEINHWYYTIQAYFHHDPTGKNFKTYMAHLSEALVTNQKEEGYWEGFTPPGKNHGPVLTTTLAAMSLMVYYRHLPTTRTVDIKPLPSPVDTPEKNEVIIHIF